MTSCLNRAKQKKSNDVDAFHVMEVA